MSAAGDCWYMSGIMIDRRIYRGICWKIWSARVEVEAAHGLNEISPVMNIDLAMCGYSVAFRKRLSPWHVQVFLLRRLPVKIWVILGVDNNEPKIDVAKPARSQRLLMAMATWSSRTKEKVFAAISAEYGAAHQKNTRNWRRHLSVLVIRLTVNSIVPDWKILFAKVSDFM